MDRKLVGLADVPVQNNIFKIPYTSIDVCLFGVSPLLNIILPIVTRSAKYCTIWMLDVWHHEPAVRLKHQAHSRQTSTAAVRSR